MPTTAEFQAAIREELAEAQARGDESHTINAGVLHRRLGGYGDGSGSNHQMAPCSNALEKEMRDGDEELPGGPTKGRGAGKTVRYRLPREGLEIPEKVGATVQHAAARQALPIIARAAKAGEKLNYQGLALALGRKPKDARAMAQVCDLLDAAATISHRPLMALSTVRDATGIINPQAWTKDALPGLRDLIIAEIETHSFSVADEEAIGSGLDQLVGMGNRKAWLYVRERVPQEEMVARLRGEEPQLPEMDSLNDLGTDAPQVVLTAGRRFVRDPAVRAAVVRRAKGKCEFCGEDGFLKADGTPYLECHHIIALAAEGEDRMTNVIALCAGHHRQAHFGQDSTILEARMTEIVRGKEAARVT